MGKWIDADALKDWSEIVPLTGDGGIDINDFDEKLASMPAADVAPVRRGEWGREIITDVYGLKHDCYVCSVCGAANDDDEFDFCPNCGAKMDGGADDA